MTRRGERLRAFAALWCDDQSMTLVVDPAIADLQREPSIRQYIAVLKVFVWCRIRGLTVPDSNAATAVGTLGRTLTWTAGLVVVLTALMVKRGDRIVPHSGFHPGPVRYVFMVPPALVITMTFGLALGVVVALGGRRISRRVAASVFLLSVASSAASFLNLGWLTPSANQAFRALYGATGQGGITELSWGELTQKIYYFSGPEFSQFGYLHALTFNYHTRLAMAFGPLVFTIFALSIAFAARNRWVPLIWAIVGCTLYWIAINANALRPWNSGLSSFAAAWIANAVVLCLSAVAMGVSALRRRDRRVQDAS